MMRSAIALLALGMWASFSGCNLRELALGAGYIDFISEDFEGITESSQLFPSDGSRWAYFQQTLEENSIEIDTTQPHSGGQSLKFRAGKSGAVVSKCDLAENKLALQEGETVLYTAWYFIEGNGSVDFLFLFDLEESTAIGNGPGIRIALAEPAGYLMVERNKYMASSLYQPEDTKIPFPRDQWVELQVEVLLSRTDDGYIKVTQDGILLINEANIQTLPRDILYFIQGTKGIYNSVQVGITANTSDNATTLYMDDIVLEILD